MHYPALKSRKRSRAKPALGTAPRRDHANRPSPPPRRRGACHPSACGPSRRAQQILKFSHTDTAVGSRQQAAELFAKKIDDYTHGRYKVQVFHSGQLANDPKAVEQLRLGGIDFTVTGTGTYATFQKPLNLSALPFLVDTYQQGWKLYDDSQRRDLAFSCRRLHWVAQKVLDGLEE